MRYLRIILFSTASLLIANTSISAAILELPKSVPNTFGQLDLLKKIVRATPENNAQIITWITRHQSELGFMFLFPLSNLLVESKPMLAMEWYLIGRIRAAYNQLLCGVNGGISIIARRTAPKTQSYAASHRKEFSEAGFRVLEREDLFKSRYTSIKNCFRQGKLEKISENRRANIEKKVRTEQIRYFNLLADPKIDWSVPNPIVEETSYPIKFRLGLKIEGKKTRFEMVSQCKEVQFFNKRRGWIGENSFSPIYYTKGVLHFSTGNLCNMVSKLGFPKEKAGTITLKNQFTSIYWLNNSSKPTIVRKFDKNTNSNGELPKLDYASFEADFELISKNSESISSPNAKIYFGGTPLFYTGSYLYFVGKFAEEFAEENWKNLPWAVELVENIKVTREISIQRNQLRELIKGGRSKIPYRYVGKSKWVLDEMNKGNQFYYFIGDGNDKDLIALDTSSDKSTPIQSWLSKNSIVFQKIKLSNIGPRGFKWIYDPQKRRILRFFKFRNSDGRAFIKGTTDSLGRVVLAK